MLDTVWHIGKKNAVMQILKFLSFQPVTHNLLVTMATSRVRVTGPMPGRRGLLRSEAGERAVVISSLRRRFGVATVRAQSSSLMGRLESLGPGSAAARNRWWQDSSALGRLFLVTACVSHYSR